MCGIENITKCKGSSEGPSDCAMKSIEGQNIEMKIKCQPCRLKKRCSPYETSLSRRNSSQGPLRLKSTHTMKRRQKRLQEDRTTLFQTCTASFPHIRRLKCCKLFSSFNTNASRGTATIHLLIRTTERPIPKGELGELRSKQRYHLIVYMVRWSLLLIRNVMKTCDFQSWKTITLQAARIAVLPVMFLSMQILK